MHLHHRVIYKECERRVLQAKPSGEQEVGMSSREPDMTVLFPAGIEETYLVVRNQSKSTEGRLLETIPGLIIDLIKVYAATDQYHREVLGIN